MKYVPPATCCFYHSEPHKNIGKKTNQKFVVILDRTQTYVLRENGEVEPSESKIPYNDQLRGLTDGVACGMLKACELRNLVWSEI